MLKPPVTRGTKKNPPGESENLKMKTETLSYTVGDTRCVGFLADPELQGRRPGILLAHEGPGLTDHMRSKAELIAELGYVVAADLYGYGRTARSGDETMALMTPLRDDVALLRTRVRAGLDVLQRLPNVNGQQLGAVGYCFGGMGVLELARSGAAVAATVCFHGLLDTRNPEDAKNIVGCVLVCTGSDDPFVPYDKIADFSREMSEANVDWQINIYGGAKHAFTNQDAGLVGRPALAYHATADRRSWEAMRALFKSTFEATA